MMLKFTNNSLLDSPVVMGILNLTPDSFYDGGNIKSINDAITHAEEMLAEGATIIDIGGCSTRPGAKEISEEEELKRVIPAIENIKKKLPKTIISIDTYRAVVAGAAIEAGADIVNDISGGTMDAKMFNVVAHYKKPYILTHIKGTPQTMQQEAQYENVTNEVISFFEEKIKVLKQMGVEQIILDPGFGFGKTLEHNYQLLASIKKVKTLGLPVLAGVSRKSMINKILNTKPENALNGTTVINTIALLNGADILRVHDVKEAMEVINLIAFYFKNRLDW